MKNRPSFRVLVVDPSPLQRHTALNALPCAGFDAAVAADGLEALELCRSFRPHLLITELTLSAMSGLELIRRSRALLPSLRVLVLTAAAGDWLTAAAFAAGADQMLLKPVSWEQVLLTAGLLTQGLPKRLETLLLAHGAPQNRAGLRQAALCAALLAGRECEQLKEAYIQVANQERTTPACVSKNIERFVKAFAAQGDLSFLSLPACSGPPANRDFLPALAKCATIPLESKDKE